MATSNNDPINDEHLSPFDDLFNGFEQFDETGRSPPSVDFLVGLLDPDANSPFGFSPDFDINSPSRVLANNVSQAAAIPSRTPSQSNQLEIIAQPYYTSRLRTREDHNRESRRHTLKARDNPSSFTSPTIRIPQSYLNLEEQHYVGVCLVTTIHEKTTCRYFHPYEIEDVDNPEFNQKGIGVWYPINHNDPNGIKSFPNLRIVFRKEQDVKTYGDLKVFYDSNANLLSNTNATSTSGRKMVHEYNLKTTQLAFIIGKKANADDSYPEAICPDSIVFSNEMVEGDGKGAAEDNKSSQSTTEPASPLPDCRIYKYAPRRGSIDGDEEVLIFYTKKLDEKKYGNLQVTFECNISNIGWTELVAPENIEVTDRMVSFKTPSFPYHITEPTPVNIILKQEKRALKTQQYFYIPKVQCSTCLANTMGTTLPTSRRNPKKRSYGYEPQGVAQGFDEADDTDAIVPVNGNESVMRPSKPQLESHSSNITTKSSTNLNQTDDEKKLMEKLEESVALLFSNNDFLPLLRICRIFIRKRPQLLHQAIHNNHADLVIKFISVAPMTLLQERNELGETVLLHAARLNRVNIVEAILNKDMSDPLFDDVNERGQNIFHLLSMNTRSKEMLDLLTTHFIEKSISIDEKFGDVDDDGYTPLQLAIVKNNLTTTRHLLKYFDQNVCVTHKGTGDNVIHLVIRYGDLPMLKYLLTEGGLNEQGTKTNVTMTPTELARSMKRNDIIEYLDERYPPPKIESSDTDDD